MEKKECPFCGEQIQKGAVKCRYCREWLSEEREIAISEEVILEEETTKQEVPQVTLEEKVESPQEEKVAIEEEEEVIVPQTKKPIAATFEEEEVPLVRWQKFKQNKILTIITFILSCIAIYLCYSSGKSTFTARLIILPLIVLMLNTYIYYQLYVYLRNFDVFYELKTLMKIMIGSYTFSCVAIILFFVAYHYMDAILLILPIISLSSISILSLIISWKLWKRTDDFVGGLESYGQFSFISTFLPGLGIFAMLFLHKVFANAEEYIEEYGYLDDDENDY